MKINHKKYIAIIALLPILIAIFGFLATASFVSECSDYSCGGGATYIFTDGIPITIWISYFLNIGIVLFIFFTEKNNYNAVTNVKRFIFIFFPLAPIAINFVIGFKLAAKNKSFFSWWWLLNLFCWGDIYKEKIKGHKH